MSKLSCTHFELYFSAYHKQYQGDRVLALREKSQPVEETKGSTSFLVRLQAFAVRNNRLRVQLV